MKVPRFTSEYVGSAPSGSPLTNEAVTALVNDLAGHEDSEAAQQNLIMRVVRDFYFAKYFWVRTRNADYEGDVRLQRAVEHLQNLLWRQAVVSIGTAMDTTLSSAGGGGGRAKRTSSLPHMLDRVALLLDSTDSDATAAKELMSTIKESVDPDRQPTLKYVRHIRNKWAGHASLDLRFDDWEGGVESLKVGYLESAMVRIVNAFEDYADLAKMSESLAAAMERPPQIPRIDESGGEWFALKIDWSSVGVLAMGYRDATEKDVEHFVSIVVAGSKDTL